LSEKPLPWSNIYQSADNQRLFDVYSELIHLKKTEPAFSTSDFSLDASGATKRLILRHDDMDVVLIANFSVIPANINPAFTQTGTWHDFFRDTNLTVSDVAAPITLLPGEFRMYTTKLIPGARRGLVSTDLDDESSSLPTELALLPNYPNPFNPSTMLSFDLPQSGDVTLEVFDVLGRRVALLLNQSPITAGRHELSFNANNLASGTYLVRLTAGGSIRNSKIQLIK
jgi:hypothetical protein